MTGNQKGIGNTRMEKTQAIPLRGTTLGGSQGEVMVTKQEREKEDAGEMVDHSAENSDVQSELGLSVVGPVEPK